jgi:hypothetical protein
VRQAVNRFDAPLTVARPDVLHFLGYPPGREPGTRIASALDDCLAEARTLVRCRGLWTTLAVHEAPAVGLDPVAASGLVIGLVTAGAAIVEAASARMARGEATAALLFDACGSAAAEEAADRISAEIVAALGGGDEARDRGRTAFEPQGRAAAVSCRISPGYGRWALASQRALFARLPHCEIGVRLEPSLLMVPRKSVSFAMWLGADARPLAGLSGCARCELESCRYRREPRAAGESGAG